MAPRIEASLAAGRLTTETGERWEVIGGGAAPVTGVGVARQDGSGWRRWITRADALGAPTGWADAPVVLWVGLPHEEACGLEAAAATPVAWFPALETAAIALRAAQGVDVPDVTLPDAWLLDGIVRAFLPAYRTAVVPEAITDAVRALWLAIDEQPVDAQEVARDELVGVLADHLNGGGLVLQGSDHIEEALRALHREVQG